MAGASHIQGWYKSSYSVTGGCVEFTTAASAVLLRDSKDQGGPHLRFFVIHWTTFVDAIKQGLLAEAGRYGRD